jgi:hypothetical protein
MAMLIALGFLKQLVSCTEPTFRKKNRLSSLLRLLLGVAQSWVSQKKGPNDLRRTALPIGKRGANPSRHH